MAATGDDSSKQCICTVAQQSIGWRLVLWIAFKYVLPFRTWFLPMALLCNLACAAKIGAARHPKDCRGLCNPHLTPQNPAGALCICPVACLIKMSARAGPLEKTAHATCLRQDFLLPWFLPPKERAPPIRVSLYHGHTQACRAALAVASAAYNCTMGGPAPWRPALPLKGDLLT